MEKPELLSVNSPEQQRVDDRVEEKLGGGKKNEASRESKVLRVTVLPKKRQEVHCCAHFQVLIFFG